MISKTSILQILENGKLDALFVTSVANITYLTSYSNFSLTEREAFVILTKQKKYLITDGRYTTAVKELCKDFEVIEHSHQYPLKKAIQDIAQNQKIKHLGFESTSLTVAEHHILKKTVAQTPTKLTPVQNVLEKVRMIKTSIEIGKIEKACKIGDSVFETVLKKIRQRVSEKEIAFEIETEIAKLKGEISFPPIVAFGKNSAIPHHQNTNEMLQKNSLVLLDFGVKFENYCSDMTRTIIFGKATDKQKNIYETVFTSQKKAITALTQQGKTIVAETIDNAARDYILSKNYPSIPHSLGHGIGVEVHELPFVSLNSKHVLKNKMVFSLEPGIYIPGFGGVRIEDLVVLENGKPRLLTQSPKHLIEL